MEKNQESMTSFNRRKILKLGAGITASSVAMVGLPSCTKEESGPTTIGGAKARRPLIIDALGGLSNSNLRMEKPSKDGVPDHDKGVDERALADVQASGLSAVNLTLGYVAGPQEPFEYSVKEIAAWDAIIRRKPDHLLKILSGEDIRRAHAEGKTGVIMGFQNSAMMGADAGRVQIFANLGVRVIQLTYNIRNNLGDGSMVAENRGLTDFGREVVAELNRNNMLVDLSHSGEQTCLDALASSKVPIAITHTGCRGVTDLPRNKSDQELKLLADKGGVAGMYFMPFLSIGRQSMAEDLVRHIEYAINVCGEDHVGIGTDGSVSAVDDMPAYREIIRAEVAQRRAAGIGAKGETADIVPMLPDLQGPEKFWKLADMLEKNGHKAARIDKILGGNFLRLMDEVWTSK